MTEAVLEVRDLVKAYSGRRVVNRLSFKVGPGEVVGLLGPNGAGKTTAFYMAIGLIHADSGQVILQGRDVTHLPIHKRAGLGMGYLAQEPSVFGDLSVMANMLSVLENLPLSRAEQKEKAMHLLADLNLTHLLQSKACALSGGERRRLEICRALATEPKILLLDEPFANVDPLTIQDVQKIIRLLTQRGISILITDHNAREIFSVVDHSYLVYRGEVLAHGTPQELTQNPEARMKYLGEEFRL